MVLKQGSGQLNKSFPKASLVSSDTVASTQPGSLSSCEQHSNCGRRQPDERVDVGVSKNKTKTIQIPTVTGLTPHGA